MCAFIKNLIRDVKENPDYGITLAIKSVLIFLLGLLLITVENRISVLMCALFLYLIAVLLIAINFKVSFYGLYKRHIYPHIRRKKQ